MAVSIVSASRSKFIANGFMNVMKGNRTSIWIVETDDGEPCGSFRIDSEGEVDFIVAPEVRGRRLGTQSFQCGLEAASKINRSLHAHIMEHNVAIMRIVEESGWKFLGARMRKVYRCFKYYLKGLIHGSRNNCAQCVHGAAGSETGRPRPSGREPVKSI